MQGLVMGHMTPKIAYVMPLSWHWVLGRLKLSPHSSIRSDTAMRLLP